MYRIDRDFFSIFFREEVTLLWIECFLLTSLFAPVKRDSHSEEDTKDQVTHSTIVRPISSLFSLFLHGAFCPENCIPSHPLRPSLSDSLHPFRYLSPDPWFW